jgi:polyisoprenyl-teichoic acid--peptidoglycan teichoic acid transferase
VLDELSTGRAQPGAARRPHRLRRVLISLVAVVLVLVVGGAAAYLAFLNHTVTSNVRHEALLPSAGEDPQAPTKDPRAGAAENILLIGSDSRAGVSGGRSDVIVLMHVNKEHTKVHLVHFPRDLYVPVPGHGKDKINAAYAYGGAPLLVRTIQGLVDVPIDHVGLIGFEGFKAMTDAVGGVRVYAEEPSTGITKGWNDLNGTQALAFVRERHQLSEGDISRGRRQQAFIKALMLKGLSKETLTNPVTLAGFIDAGTKNLTLDKDFSVADLRSQAFGMRGIRGKDIVFITAPFSGFGTSPVGGSIDIVDQPRMQDLSVALRSDDMESFPAGKQIP